MNKNRFFVFHTLPLLADTLPMNLLIALTGQRFIYPFYHTVSDNEILHIKHLYRVRSIKEFIADLDYLLKYFEPVDIGQVLTSFREQKPLKKKGFFLSFDDGLREFHDVIAPILTQKGLPAVCFLNSAFIGNKDLFYRYKASLLAEKMQTNPLNDFTTGSINELFRNTRYEGKEICTGILEISYHDRNLLDDIAGILEFDFNDYLDKNRPYLDPEQIRSLIRQGFSFGAHSIDHPEYFRLSEDDQVFQTHTSIDDICNEFGLKSRLFSFPFTDHGVKQSFFNRIFDPGNRIADLTFGGAGLKRDEIPLNIQRIPFEETALTAGKILKTEYLYYIIKSLFGKNIIVR